MTEKNQQPRPYDAVLGGNSPDLSNALVLGGIEGATLRFNSTNIDSRLLALKQATQYGEKGLDLIIKGLEDSSEQVQKTAYLLLKDRTETKVKERIKGVNQTIKVWDINTGECLKTLSSGHSNIVWSLAISPDCQTIVSGGSWNEYNINIWDINTGSCLKTLSGHSDFVSSIAISPDGKTIVSGSRDKTIKIWAIAE